MALPDLTKLSGQFYLYIGHPPGHESGLTHYAFIDSQAVARLHLERFGEDYCYGFVHELNHDRRVSFPFNAYVPIRITSQQRDGDYLNLEGRVDSILELDVDIIVLDQQQVTFKLKHFFRC
ncbi:MAG TPA: hypothetical protein VJH68_05475 [Candidatus Nanoarchaeia archaeon]|nr:hypothetical protein [Candidatus Nanoarchaeia archaeon]